MARDHAMYRPRHAEASVLHAVIRQHLDEFLRAAADRADGAGLPEFIAREFREFLTCGVLAHGFARVRCGRCALERLVPFSCKGRGFCPSCGGRRMTERAAHLVDAVLPAVPVRQWVLTLPYRLRYLLAWDHGLTRAVLAVYARALLGFYRRQAHRHGIRDGRTGTLTVVQRFGSGLNLNVHFHTVAFDGVFSRTPAGPLTFHPAIPPIDAEVANVLDIIRRRVRRLLRHRGLEPADEGAGPDDALAETSRALAGIVGASVQGRVALGPRAGSRVRRLGDLRPSAVETRGPRQAHLEGFDLHANVWVGAHDRARREQLCRYLLRPPLADDRLRVLGDGRVRVRLKRAWSDGTTHLLFEPDEFLEKLAALTPRPAINLILYHGVLAPHARWRPAVVAYGRLGDAATAPHEPMGRAEAERGGAARSRYWTWAALMRRAFDLDVLRCPRCAGRMELIATVDDPAVIHRILAHLALPSARDDPESAAVVSPPRDDQPAPPFALPS
jgi:putative transposase/transposase-like zinc-binding protein